MTDDDVRKLLVAVLKDARPNGWAVDYRFLGDALDSLDHASFVLALEEARGFKVPDDDLASLDTIAHVVDYAAARAGRAAE